MKICVHKMGEARHIKFAFSDKDFQVKLNKVYARKAYKKSVLEMHRRISVRLKPEVVETLIRELDIEFHKFQAYFPLNTPMKDNREAFEAGDYDRLSRNMGVGTEISETIGFRKNTRSDVLKSKIEHGYWILTNDEVVENKVSELKKRLADKFLQISTGFNQHYKDAVRRTVKANRDTFADESVRWADEEIENLQRKIKEKRQFVQSRLNERVLEWTDGKSAIQGEPIEESTVEEIRTLAVNEEIFKGEGGLFDL